MFVVLLAGVLAAGCGGDGDLEREAPEPQPPVPALRERVFDSPVQGEPGYLIAGDNASVQYWMNSSGEVSQSLYRSADGTASVRTFNDALTGQPTTVLDERSGRFVSIRAYSLQRADFWMYDGSGAYQGGFSIFQDAGAYYSGDIDGVPAHGGMAVAGPLNPAAASWTGSFRLMGDIADGLSDVQPVPAGMAALIDGLTSSGAVASGAAGSHPVLAQFDPFSLQSRLRLAGMLYAGEGVAERTRYIDVAGPGFLAWPLVPEIVGGIRTRWGRDCPQGGRFAATCRELTALVANHLSNADGSGFMSAVQNVTDWLAERPTALNALVDNGVAALDAIADGLSESDAIGEENLEAPSSSNMPAVVAAKLSGSASRDDGTSVALQGDIDGNGNVGVAGTDGQGDLVSLNFAIHTDGSPLDGGTFEWGADMGNVGRKASPPPATNQPPVADAGSNQIVVAGTMVILSGEDSYDPEDGELEYEWEQTGGTMVMLSGEEDAMAMFTAPDVAVDETLTFRLTVADDGGAEASAEVGVRVTAAVEGEGFTSVSAGNFHACGVRDTGAVECWGRNDAGQTGAPEDAAFDSVSAGWKHTCGVLLDDAETRSDETGEVECWGLNDEDESTPPTGAFVSVSAGGGPLGGITCGVRNTGYVECWGSFEAECGEPVQDIWECPDDERSGIWPPEATFISVSVGTEHACGVRTTGEVGCWGLDNLGQSSPPPGRFRSVSAMANHNCGVRGEGAVECWGHDTHGQTHPPEGTFRSVSAGGAHVCGVLQDDTVRCWGRNDDGESSPPEGIFVSIDAGGNHTCGVRGTGAVACWGHDRWGQSSPPDH